MSAVGDLGLNVSMVSNLCQHLSRPDTFSGGLGSWSLEQHTTWPDTVELTTSLTLFKLSSKYLKQFSALCMKSLYPNTNGCPLSRPSYLAANVTGRPYKGWANHFVPQSPIFNRSEQFWVLVSDVALVAVMYGLYTLAGLYGPLWLFKVRFLLFGRPLQGSCAVSNSTNLNGFTATR
jgi:hypothetical protein